MVPANEATVLVDVGSRGGKHPLPRPFPGRLGELAFEGFRQGDAARPDAEILLVLETDSLEVSAQRPRHTRREYGDPVLLSLAVAHGELVAAEVDVLDAKARTFEQPKP